MDISPFVAARELEITTKTLATWAKEGRIKFTWTGSGRRLFPLEEVQRLKKEIRRPALTAR